MEAAQLSIHRLDRKIKTVVYLYNRIQSCDKNGWTTDAHKNESPKTLCQVKEALHQRLQTAWSISYEMLEQTKLISRSEVGTDWEIGGMMELSQVTVMFNILKVWSTQVYMFVKTDKMIPLRFVDFTWLYL